MSDVRGIVTNKSGLLRKENAMVIGNQSYVPTLKAREAEIKALLRAPMSLALTPLFELQRSSAGGTDPKTGQARRMKRTPTDVSYFLDDIARLWDAPLYVDISRIARTDNRSNWWNLLATLNSLEPTPAQLIPVLIPDSDPPERRAAAGVAAITGRAALRVPMVTARNNPVSLTGLTAVVAADISIPTTKVDVVLDWADSTESLSLDTLVSDTVAVIDALQGAHGRLVTSGTPNSSAFLQVGDWHTTRREWWLWLRLAYAGHNVDYGDYALYSPADPAPVTPLYGHLRYSSSDILHVHRRAKPKTGGGLAGAFEECCRHLVGQSYWLGAGFSSADQRFNDIAGGDDKESAPGKWRQLAAEHHFAVVAQQFVSPPAAPAPGTT